MTKFEVTDAIVSAAAWAHQTAPTRIGHPFIPMRAAITAALNASGLLERIAELEAAIENALNPSVPTRDATLRLMNALNKEPTP